MEEFHKYDLNIVKWHSKDPTYHILSDDNYDNFVNGAAFGTYFGHTDLSEVIGFSDKDHIFIGNKKLSELNFILEEEWKLVPDNFELKTGMLIKSKDKVLLVGSNKSENDFTHYKVFVSDLLQFQE